MRAWIYPDTTSTQFNVLDRLVKAINHTAGILPAWPLYLVGAAWAGWLLWLGVNGQLGIDPVKELEHSYGETGLKMLVLVLAITPLRRYTRINLIKFRRALGLLAFGAILLHLLVWLLLDVQIPNRIWEDIFKRPYITIGMAAFVLMLPLALTSNNYSIRKLKARWGKLHRLTYLIALLGCLHFLLLVKGFQPEPLVYLLVVVLLLLLRYRTKQRR